MIHRSRRLRPTALMFTLLVLVAPLLVPAGPAAAVAGDAVGAEGAAASSSTTPPAAGTIDDPLVAASSEPTATTWTGELPAPLPDVDAFTAEPTALPDGSFQTQIVGGATATRVPTASIARIVYGIAPGFTCTGTLVAPQWVLTAGHCLVQYDGNFPVRVANEPAGYAVYFGGSLASPVAVTEVRLSDGYLVRTSSEDVPGFRNSAGVPCPVTGEPLSWCNGSPNLANDTGLDDFGLLRLASPVAAAPIPLAVDDLLGQSGRTVWAAGWGLTGAGTAPATLQEAAMTMANTTYCEIAWRSYYSARSSACFIGTTTATCNGDSGGPVLSQDEKGGWWIVAIVSGGAAGCPVNSPYLGPRSQWMASWVAQRTGQAQNGRPGESFNPVVPTRIVDSREALGVAFIPPTVFEPSSLGIYLPQPTLPAGFVTRRPITGANGVSGLPASGVAGVVLNVTVDQAKAGGFVAVYPCADGWNGTSSVNFAAGQTVANLVVTKVDRNGDICIQAAAETAVIVDLTGWLGPQGTDRSTRSAVPDRLYDSRDAQQAPLAAGTTVPVQVTGGAGRPPVGAKAAVLNVTSTNALQPGFVTVFPCGTTPPLASNLNPVPGRDVPNSVMVQLDNLGRVCLFTATASHLVVDLNGWVETGPGKARTVPPTRLVDTRDNGVRVAANQPLILPVTDRAGVPSAAATDSVLLNVTVTDPAAAGFLTAYPCGPVPWVSNLNFVPGQTVPNAVMAKVDGSGNVCLRSTAAVHMIVDVTGSISK